MESPTSPSAALREPTQTQAQGGNALPFKGSFTRSSTAEPCPPPPAFTINATATGNATHVGSFTARSVDNVTGTSAIGTWDFTSSDGDQLLSETEGVENAFEPPNVSRVTLRARIVGGTGRFAGASGQFTMQFAEAIDFAACSGEGQGTFEGELNLNR
jgi:hypothetical protein